MNIRSRIYYGPASFDENNNLTFSLKDQKIYNVNGSLLERNIELLNLIK
jgi:hypothetical protein